MLFPAAAGPSIAIAIFFTPTNLFLPFLAARFNRVSLFLLSALFLIHFSPAVSKLAIKTVTDDCLPVFVFYFFKLYR